MPGGQLLDRLRPRSSRVLGAIPLGGRHGGEEILHRLLVSEEGSVEVARVPIDEDAAEVEHDRRDASGDARGPVRAHASGGYKIKRRRRILRLRTTAGRVKTAERTNRQHGRPLQAAMPQAVE
jgi:hypothetical protein